MVSTYPAALRPTTSRRSTWMDVSRGVAVLLVVLGHAVFMAKASPDSLHWVVDFLRPFRIPTLLLLSGLLLGRSLSRAAVAYLNGKWRGILWPLLVWNLLVWVMLPDPPALTDPAYWLQPGHLWYLLHLFAYYLLALACRRVPPAVPIALLALAWFVTRDQVVLSEFFRYGIFFFVGHGVARARPGLRAPQSWRWLAPAGAGAIVFGVLHTTGAVSYRHPLSLVWILAGIAVLIGLCSALDRRLQPVFLRWVGRNSLVFYVTHFPVVVVLVHAQALLWPGGAPWHWAVNLVGALAVCSVAAWMQRFGLARLPYRAPFPLLPHAPGARTASPVVGR